MLLVFVSVSLLFEQSLIFNLLCHVRFDRVIVPIVLTNDRARMTDHCYNSYDIFRTNQRLPASASTNLPSE